MVATLQGDWQATFQRLGNQGANRETGEACGEIAAGRGDEKAVTREQAADMGALAVAVMP